MADEETTETSTREPPYPLIYIGRSSRAIARHYGDRLAQLDESGFDVHVLAADDGGFEQFAEAGFQGRRLPVGTAWNIPGWLGAFFIVQGYFIEQRPVLVHGFDGPLAWLSALAARRAETPAVFATIDDHRLDVAPADFGSTSLRVLLPELIERLESRLGESVASEALQSGAMRMYHHLGEMVTRYFATDERQLRQLRDEDVVPIDKLEHGVPANGVDTDHYDPEEAPAPEEVREAFSTPDRWRRYFGYAGPLRPDRGGTELLQTIETLSQRRRDVGWLIAISDEDVPRDESILSRLRDFEARDLVRLVDDVDEIDFFRALDLFVLPGGGIEAVREGMKAAALKVCTAAYDVPGASTLVSDGQTGRIVDADDRAEWIETLETLAGDPQRLANYGVRARSRATERLDRRRIDRGMLDIYDRILRDELTS